MRRAFRILALLGISGWVILAIALGMIYMYRHELRAARYWALDRSVLSGDTSSVRLLLFLGADPTGFQDYKTFIAKGGFFEFSSPLCQAAWTGRTEVARLLLEAGANPNTKEGEGWTPLLAAAKEGHKDTVILLLQNEADFSVRGPDGMNASEYARKYHEEDIATAIEEWKK